MNNLNRGIWGVFGDRRSNHSLPILGVTSSVPASAWANPDTHPLPLKQGDRVSCATTPLQNIIALQDVNGISVPEKTIRNDICDLLSMTHLKLWILKAIHSKH
jgi:hypothetical protein